MRAISTAQDAALTSSGAGRSEFVRVSVRDAGGTFRDLTTYPGVDMVDSATWQEDSDTPVMSADIKLRREDLGVSLAPLITSSPLNHGFDPAAAYSALIALRRRVRIEVAVMAGGAAPSSSDWMTVFEGRLDSMDMGAGDQISLACRDLGGQLQDIYLEDEYVLSYGAVSGTPVAMRIWQPGTDYRLGDYVLPTDANANARFYNVTTAGTSGSTEPAWPTSGTVGSGSVVFTYAAATVTTGFSVESVIQSLLTQALSVAGVGSVTLYTPVSPSWVITQYKCDRGPVMDAIRALALQIGWDLRYKWRSGTAQFELTLFGPDRTTTTALRTFTPDEYSTIGSLKTDSSGIRNAVRIIYGNAAALDPEGHPTRTSVLVTDATSINLYGRRYMEVSEGSTSQIDSTSEATVMANACLADLKDPVIDQSLDFTHGFPFVEIGDLYQFNANYRHYSANQKLAVYSYSHEAKDGFIKTTLGCRGTAVAGYDRWLIVENRPGATDQPSRLVPFNNSGAALVFTGQPIVGGLKLFTSSSPPIMTRGTIGYEFHVDASSAAFLPSSSTLQKSGASNEASLSNLIPRQTYYAKLVPYVIDDGGVRIRGQPSAALTLVAGSANALHISPDLTLSYRPAFWNFATQTLDVATHPPDGWSILTGTWGAANDVYENTSIVRTGARSMEFRATAVASSLVSDYFEVSPGVNFFIEAYTYVAVAYGLNFRLDFYSSKGVYISSSGWTNLVLATTGAWQHITWPGTTPATARFAQFAVGKPDASAKSLLVDFCRYFEQNEQSDPIGYGFANTFLEQDSTNSPALYRRDTLGKVSLVGRIKPGASSSIGTTGTARWSTLAAGWRPLRDKYFTVPFWDGALAAMSQAVLYINTSGQLYFASGNVNAASWWSTDGVSFFADL